LRPGVYLFRDPQDIPNHDILNGPVAVCRVNFLKGLGFRRGICHAEAIPPRPSATLHKSKKERRRVIALQRLQFAIRGSLSPNRIARVTRATARTM